MIKIKALHENAKTPTYGTEGAACFDLYAATFSLGSNPSQAVYGTGLAFELPEDHVMLVFSRSGHGFNDGVRLSNCVGVIDQDYRGEVKVKLQSDGKNAPIYKFGADSDRVAQGLVIPVKQFGFMMVDELGDTDRGENGFGSTDQDEDSIGSIRNIGHLPAEMKKRVFEFIKDCEGYKIEVILSSDPKPLLSKGEEFIRMPFEENTDIIVFRLNR